MTHKTVFVRVGGGVCDEENGNDNDNDNDNKSSNATTRWVRVNLWFVSHAPEQDPSNDNDSDSDSDSYCDCDCDFDNDTMTNQKRNFNLDQPHLPALSDFEASRDLVLFPSYSPSATPQNYIEPKTYHCLKLAYVLHDKLCMIKKKKSTEHSTTERERERERDRDLADAAYILSSHLASVCDEVRYIPMELRTSFVYSYNAMWPNDLMTDYFARVLWVGSGEEEEEEEGGEGSGD